MKQYLKIKPRAKKTKPSAIENYKVSYLDKRSKTYHRIVMTAFAGLFGFAGLLFVFSSNAASDETVGKANSNNLQVVLIALAIIFIAALMIYWFVRKKP